MRRVSKELEHLAQSGDQGLSRGLFYAISVFLCRLVGMTFFEVRVKHVGRVPDKGPTLLASTHQSYLDPWMVGMSPHRKSCYFAKDALFRVPLLGWLIRRYDAFPVERESAASRGAMEIALRLLEKGRCLVFFPEGTRSMDGRIQPLKRGVVLLARRTGARVVPVLVHGSYYCWRRGWAVPRPGQVFIVFGDPIRMEVDESSDSFMERLSLAYRRLAIEAGAQDAIGDEPGPGKGPEESQESWPVPQLQTAGESSWIAGTAKPLGGGLSAAEA